MGRGSQSNKMRRRKGQAKKKAVVRATIGCNHAPEKKHLLNDKTSGQGGKGAPPDPNPPVGTRNGPSVAQVLVNTCRYCGRTDGTHPTWCPRG